MSPATGHPPQECIVVGDRDDAERLAPLVDDVRQRIVDAWDAGDDPRYLLVGDATYAALLRAKGTEVARAQRLYLLGLTVERHDDVR